MFRNFFGVSILFLFFVTFFYQNSWAETNYDFSKLGFPEINSSTNEAAPGNEVVITVSNLPLPPEGTDPRVEFFIHLPFSQAVGTNVPDHCGGKQCIPLYTFDQIQTKNLETKELTLTLFSINNPAPNVNSGALESICDLRINGKVIQSYGKACNEFDQPQGNYEIKFGWGIKQADVYDLSFVIPFTVLEPIKKQKEVFQNPDDLVIGQFEKGLISEEELEEKLKDLGYDPDLIRKVKGMLGILEHQKGQPRIIIPEWIKNNAKWWSEDKIDDSDFVAGIQYLIQKEVMTIPHPGKSVWSESEEIPDWVKKNAKWWSQGLISDIDFVKGIQYLIEKGIMRIQF